MATDVFNNPSNDYVNPGLAPCANVPDGNSGEFKFIDDGAGVVVGSEIVQFMDLSGLSIDVTEWSGRKQTIQSGEVIYVPGPDKGLLNRKQVFSIPTDETDQKYYFIIDLSIGYYNNFRYYNINLEASANYSLNIDIDDALNIALSNRSIKAEATYSDPSTLSFTGTQLGYEFDISNVVLTIIDASMDSTSPFPAIIIDNERVPQTYTLTEDASSALPASKYPNGAMLGYVLKANYPSDECYRTWWLYMNHVHSPFDVYVETDLITAVTDISIYKSIEFDASIIWPPIAGDISINVPTFDCSGTWNYDPSIVTTIPDGVPVADVSVEYYGINDSSVSGSTIFFSKISNVVELSGNTIYDSSIYGSDIWNVNSVALATPSLKQSFISDSSIYQFSGIDSFVQSSWIRSSYFQDSSITCSWIYDSSISADVTYSQIWTSEISNSNVLSSVLEDSSITNTVLEDSSILNSYLISSQLSGGDVSAGDVYSSYIKNTTLYNAYIEDSSLYSIPIQGDTSILNSDIENSWFNAYIFLPGVWTDDVSASTIYVNGGNIQDTSIYNTTVYDASIYTSRVYDSSLIRCTLYNTDVEDSTTVTDCLTIYWDSSCNVDVSIFTDSSTYYQKYSKIVNVGMSGCGDTTTLSAADYLDYINTHDLWFKVGQFASRFTAPDVPESSEKNLIGGFYLFNPQTYPVNIEYMILNKVES